jgi:hypothetical protein
VPRAHRVAGRRSALADRRWQGISLLRVNVPAPGLVPVHIGQPEPGSDLEQTLLARLERERGRYDLRLRVPGALDWRQHGMRPRWLGMETSDCAVALEPGFFTGHGADERDRFLAGAGRRGEVALVVAVIGDVKDDGPRNPLARSDSSVILSRTLTSVGGRRLPAGTRPEIAPDLGSADHDLALRLLNRPADAPWWSLHLSGGHTEKPGGYNVEYEAEGQLRPILIDALGEPVVAAWVPPSEDQRWYIIPDAADWDNILDWLMQRALPEYAPGALRRARSPHFADPDLQTAGELAARQALDGLDATYAEERLHLQQELREAKARAEPVRYELLYGTGAELVRAVTQVLTAAGLHTVDLDQELGGTKSADLLVSADGPPGRLVEVKAASGAAPESLVGHLERHLATWPQLRPGEPVTGGVLIVNHQHRLHPSERTTSVYSRPEFVAALPITVVSTVELFHWWRAADWTTIRTTMLGVERLPAAEATAPVEGTEASLPTPPSRRRRWRPGTPSR